MDMNQLTQGAVVGIFSGEIVNKPVLQVIDIKKIQGPPPPGQPSNQPERFRLVISDGVFYQQAMLATQLNHLVGEGIIKNYGIVRLTEHICNTVHNRRIVIILQIEVLNNNVSTTIGNPQNVETAGGSVPQPPQQQQAPQQSHYPPAPSYQSGPQQQQQQQVSHQQQRQPAPVQQFRGQGGAAGGAGGGGGGAVGAPIGGSGEDISQQPIHPIRTLNPYQGGRWTIKARVTFKSDIKNWQPNQRNPKGGKLFSIDLVDNQGGSIRATLFNEQVDKFFPVLESGGIYYISKGPVKFANKKYSSNKNEYEITFDHNTIVQQCMEDTSIPLNHYAFIPIAQVSDCNKDDTVDVMGIVTNVGAKSQITTKSKGEQLDKRTLTLADSSGKSIDLTLWGALSDFNVSGDSNPVLAVKGAKVSDFNNRTLGSLSSTHLDINPDIDQAHALRGWWESQGRQDMSNIVPLSAGGPGAGDGSKSFKEPDRKTFSQIKDEGLGHNQADYFKTRGTITLIKHDGTMYYNACPGKGEDDKECNKKVTQQGSSWYCEKCRKAYEYCIPRYILSMAASDHTGSSWLSAFNDIGVKIIGKPAADIASLKDQHNDPAVEAIFQDATFKTFNFRIRAKEEDYQNEMRVKCSILNAEPLDYVAESKLLLADIRKYHN